MTTEFICALPESVRIEIAWALIRAGIRGEDLQDAMDSRLCDLADTIDIGRFQ